MRLKECFTKLLFIVMLFFAGVIKLRESLDREREDVIDVVVTIQDENYVNVVPFR